MKSILITAVAAILACAAPAQISGSLNRNAPTVAQSITMGENKLEVNYTAIRFGQGSWQKILESVQMHERFNGNAEKKPVGSIKTTVAVMAAGKEIPAGEYALYFTVMEKAGWILNLKPKAGGDAIMWRMVLQPSQTKSECMGITLEPTAQDNTCSLTIRFGEQHVTVPVTVGAAAKKEEKQG
jgi:hypothetical protein